MPLFATRAARALTCLVLPMAGLAPAQAQTTLALSSWVPPTHALTTTQVEWCAMLEQKVPGKIKCNALPRAVAAPPGTFDAVRNGLADISFAVHGYTPSRFVTPQLAEFPFLGNSSETVSVAFQRIYAKNPAIAEEHKGVKVLAAFTHGPGIVFNTKRPITKVEDLSGLKFRVGGGMVNEIAKTLGMNVTLKPAPESYELLSTGVMDGTLFPAESAESFKIEKIIRYATTVPRWPVQHQLRVRDEPGQVRLAAARREEGDRRDVGRVPVAHGRARVGQGRSARHRADAGQRRGVHQGRCRVRQRGEEQDQRPRGQLGQGRRSTRPERREEGARRLPRRDLQAREVTLR